MTSPTSDIVARALQIASAADGSSAGAKDALRECAALISSLVAERDAARDLADRLKLEAQGHAQEAGTANSTIYEIYQVLSGGKGEPGNWHGAEPARQYVATAERLLAEAREKMNIAHQLATTVRDRRSTADSPAPDDIQAVVEATRPTPVATLSVGGVNG